MTYESIGASKRYNRLFLKDLIRGRSVNVICLLLLSTGFVFEKILVIWEPIAFQRCLFLVFWGRWSGLSVRVGKVSIRLDSMVGPLSLSLTLLFD